MIEGITGVDNKKVTWSKKTRGYGPGCPRGHRRQAFLTPLRVRHRRPTSPPPRTARKHHISAQGQEARACEAGQEQTSGVPTPEPGAPDQEAVCPPAPPDLDWKRSAPRSLPLPRPPTPRAALNAQDPWLFSEELPHPRPHVPLPGLAVLTAPSLAPGLAAPRGHFLS